MRKVVGRIHFERVSELLDGTIILARHVQSPLQAEIDADGQRVEVYRRLLPRLGHNQTIGAIAHRLCRLIWMILHQGVRYEERCQGVCERLKRTRTARMIRQLQSLGYRVEALTVHLNLA